MKRNLTLIRTQQFLRGLALCCLAITFVGCEPPAKVGKVAGNVSFAGKPVAAGSVIFENMETNESVMAAIQPDGSYVALTFNRPGLLVGKYRVAITPNQISSGEEVVASNPAESKPPPATIPTKYHSPSTSGLTADVQLGQNPPFNFDLPEK